MAEHLLCKERVRSSSLLVSTTTERTTCTRTHPTKSNRPGSSPGTILGTSGRAVARRLGGLDLEPSFRVSGPQPTGPLIRALPSEATDQRTAGQPGDLPAGKAPSNDGSHLNNWICVSAVNRVFDFAELSRNDPERPRQRPTAWSDAEGGQATHGTGWMPWRQEPMKDVAGCEKLRGVASRR